MAKARAKKSETGEGATGEGSPERGAAPKRGGSSRAKKATKPVRKGPKPAAASAGPAPLIDTGLAAQSAARMLLSRAKLREAAGGTSQEPAEAESSAFKQIKESLQRPSGKTATNVLGNVLGPQKSNLPHAIQKQTAHNQTQGGVNRINVPRRTSG